MNREGDAEEDITVDWVKICEDCVLLLVHVMARFICTRMLVKSSKN